MSSSWRCERNKTINAEINFRGMSRPVVPVMVQAKRGVPSTQVWPLMKNYNQSTAGIIHQTGLFCVHEKDAYQNY